MRYNCAASNKNCSTQYLLVFIFNTSPSKNSSVVNLINYHQKKVVTVQRRIVFQLHYNFNMSSVEVLEPMTDKTVSHTHTHTPKVATFRPVIQDCVRWDQRQAGEALNNVINSQRVHQRKCTSIHCTLYNRTRLIKPNP